MAKNKFKKLLYMVNSGGICSFEEAAELTNGLKSLYKKTPAPLSADHALAAGLLIRIFETRCRNKREIHKYVASLYSLLERGLVLEEVADLVRHTFYKTPSAIAIDNFSYFTDDLKAQVLKNPMDAGNRALRLIAKIMPDHRQQDTYAALSCNLIGVIIDVLSLNECKIRSDQRDLLQKMKIMLSETSRFMFGKILAERIRLGQKFAKEILSQIYSLRLGLHCVTHLNNQLTHMLEPKTATTETKVYLTDTDFIVYADIILMFGDLLFDIACSDRTRAWCIQEMRSIARLLNHLSVIKATKLPSHADSADQPFATLCYQAHPLTLHNLIRAIIDEIDRASKIEVAQKKAILEINTGFSKISAVISFHEQGCVFSCPQLPQGHVRFEMDEYKSLIDCLMFMFNELAKQVAKPLASMLEVKLYQAGEPQQQIRRTITPSYDLTIARPMPRSISTPTSLSQSANNVVLSPALR